MAAKGPLSSSEPSPSATAGLILPPWGAGSTPELPAQRVGGTSGGPSSPLSTNHSWDRLLPLRELKRRRFPLTGKGRNPGEALTPLGVPFPEPQIQPGPHPPSPSAAFLPLLILLVLPFLFPDAPGTFCTPGAATKPPNLSPFQSPPGKKDPNLARTHWGRGGGRGGGE